MVFYYRSQKSIIASWSWTIVIQMLNALTQLKGFHADVLQVLPETAFLAMVSESISFFMHDLFFH